MLVVPAQAIDTTGGETTLVGAGPVNVTEATFVAQGCAGGVTPENGADGWAVELPEGSGGSTARLITAPGPLATVSAAFYTADCSSVGTTPHTHVLGWQTFSVPADAHWMVVRAHDGLVRAGILFYD